VQRWFTETATTGESNRTRVIFGFLVVFIILYLYLSTLHTYAE
jgi:hypothetical protein